MKILFIHNDLRSFVRSDLQILRSEYIVKSVLFSSDNKHLADIAQGVKWCDLIFGWWASWHMFFPIFFARKFRKPVIVIGGDYDVIYDKEAKSGKRLVLDKFREWLGYYLFPRIDRFITFSEFSKSQALKLPYIIPDRVSRIYCGLPDIASSRGSVKENLILTVGTINQYDIYRKGYAAFVKSANYLPAYQYKLIGPWKDDSINLLRSWNDTNVSYTGYLSDQDLYRAMDKAKVYAQISHHEGFGMALAEAMLFQCVPVVTQRGSIPEVVGDCGIYVPYDDPKETVRAIQEACERGSELGLCARERILSLYPIENRKHELIDMVEQTYSQYFAQL